ncbi:MAG: DUF4390 domain-containing protein [Candidatus Rokubacteria bacterium]|nr:DUF4390 domain-containing protein [Candidatus Rokubacteria bacterium]
MRAPGAALLLVVAALAFVLAGPAQAELRISDLDVFLNDFDITVRVVLLGTIPPTFHEGLTSGMPAHVRFTIELWQFNRLWPDRLLTTKVVERSLAYNVVTKEYKVTPLKGESWAPYTTRDLRDAQRVLSEVRAVKLTASTTLDATEVFYVRVRAEAALNGDTSFFARLAGTAEQTTRQSDYRTITRIQ